ncbi:DNA-binding CsgD family transcriptional regulator [Arthrobacter stackebrandtii]|uniref:DNA-binding CsgD family transcriptional regulator n=1 Tax=Arthrobacter stackebrandtii TaxID=272161 RepID=A0ABS4Z0K4_9MICC|nr:DNA-binding CsgD family transcriptional regulator [Arthrobacter stackebrandtii]PYH01630.1 hypothetical protein CVV67_03950 [Arthrobacter stackebrandtii]
MHQLETVVNLVGGLDSLTRPAQFPEFVVPALAALIGCDVATYNEIGPRGVSYWDFPRGSLGIGTRETFARYVDEHPLVNHYRHSIDGTPVKISDFMASAQFHRLNLYEYFFRPIPVEHQIAITVTARGPTVIGIALNRTRHDFSESDRDLLSVLRRPLADTYSGLLRISELRAQFMAAPGRSMKQLTPAELDVLRRAASGATNAAIARQLGCSPRTVAKHLEHVYRKLDVVDRSAAAARYASDDAAWKSVPH